MSLSRRMVSVPFMCYSVTHAAKHLEWSTVRSLIDRGSLRPHVERNNRLCYGPAEPCQHVDTVSPGNIEQSIPERFKKHVARAPDSIAVRTRTCELSFARLDSWSNTIAATLLRLGAGSEPVPFLLPQGPLAIATTLGILKAGKFYVPLDPAWGSRRATALVSDLNARVLLTDAEFAPSLRGRGLDIIELSPDPPADAIPPSTSASAPTSRRTCTSRRGPRGRRKA